MSRFDPTAMTGVGTRLFGVALVGKGLREVFTGDFLIAGLARSVGGSAADSDPHQLARLRPLARYALGVFLLACGVEHFVYVDFMDTLLPSWIPPGPRPWTYLAGSALIGGGAGSLVAATARLTASLSAPMVFLWALMLRIPRAVSIRSIFELDGVFEALAVTGVALLVAATLPADHRRRMIGASAP